MHRVTPLPSYLVKRLERWRATNYAENRSWFSHLAEHGQHPRTMFISCCDSRVDPVSMFEGEPGDFFIVRNVANIVPPHAPDHEHHGTSAAIEFAVTGLGVSHIVVMGHSGCGGVAACDALCSRTDGKPGKTEGFIDNWIRILAPAWKNVDATADDATRLRRLEQEGVKVSLANLLTFPFVASAVQEGRLALHGLWTDVGSGSVHVYQPGTDDYAEL
ncbi:carbonic anhydrase [Roseobacter sp. HKCCA0434]|uniref:carbonic anhydrase n=1 Tax=Roseobacter sp. HKCCA0434 TaxID=3079297 RepID=UPI002905A435|nr:carbonic anhydrase [Roseobacter sp. HKCCA0434]